MLCGAVVHQENRFLQWYPMLLQCLTAMQTWILVCPISGMYLFESIRFLGNTSVPPFQFASTIDQIICTVCIYFETGV